MSAEKSLDEGSGILLQFMANLPVGMQVFYGAIMAAIVTMVVGSFALALTGMDDRIFPNEDKATELVVSRIDTLEKNNKAHIDAVKAELTVQIKGIVTDVVDLKEIIARMQTNDALTEQTLSLLADRLSTIEGNLDVRYPYVQGLEPR